jgi:hypothetical protein
MARGWSFIGGLMIVTTITYLNMELITAKAKAIQSSLARERKKLEEAARNNPNTSENKPMKWATPQQAADRVKKMWNEDIERGIRRMQTTDWERMGRAVEAQMKRAKERVTDSFSGEDSKKKSP